MRGNAWQITAIIAIILVIVLIVPLVIMGRNYQTLTTNEREARDEQRSTAQRAATLEGEVRALKTLIRGADTLALDVIQREHAELMTKTFPGEDPTAHSYHDAAIALNQVRDRLGDAIKTSQERFAQLESDFNEAQRTHEAVVAEVRRNLATAQNERDEAQNNFSRDIANYDAQLRDAQE